MQEMQVRSLAGEKEMATHSCILVCEIPETEGPCRLQSIGLKEWDMTEHLSKAQHSYVITWLKNSLIQ